jgi:hypothetical protein
MANPYLRACPFCGHSGELTDSDKTRVFGVSEAFGYTVLCNGAKGGCGATCGYWETEAEAADRWNERAAPPTPQEHESEFQAQWRRDRFLELKALLELNDADEATVMNMARVRISRLDAVENVFKGVLSDPAGVYAAMSALASEDITDAQVSLVLAAARQVVQDRRPDVLRAAPSGRE